MPTETFLNLADEKRQAFIETALKEFADNNYDSASINKQYIVVLGDDAPPQKDSSGNKPPPLYFVKVS